MRHYWILLLLLIPAPIYAENIGVSLSKTCLQLISLGDDTCPGYDEIITLFPDTTNHLWSGGFAYEGDIFTRQQPVNDNHFNYYRHNGSTTTIWIDPPGDVRDRIKMINIEVDLPEYKLKGKQSLKDNIFTLGHSRHVDDCWNSTITAKDWVFLVGDTMRYLDNECEPEFTQFDSIREYHQKVTAWDYTKSYWYAMEKWFKDSIENCGTKLCF